MQELHTRHTGDERQVLRAEKLRKGKMGDMLNAAAVVDSDEMGGEPMSPTSLAQMEALADTHVHSSDSDLDEESFGAGHGEV